MSALPRSSEGVDEKGRGSSGAKRPADASAPTTQPRNQLDSDTSPVNDGSRTEPIAEQACTSPTLPPPRPDSGPSTAPFAHSFAYEEIGADNEGVFAFIHPLLLCALIFTFIAFALLLVAIPTVNWYIIIFGDETTKFGLYRSCVNGVCGGIEYADQTFLDCSRTAGGWRFRNHVAQGTALAAVGLCLVAFVFGVLSRKILTELRCTAIVLSANAAIVLVLLGGVVRFVFTYEVWLFCDENFCKYMERTGMDKSCDASFGFSFGLVLIAMGSALVALVFTIIRVALKNYTFTRRREVERGSPMSPLSPTHSAYRSFEATTRGAASDAAPPPPGAIGSTTPDRDDSPLPPHTATPLSRRGVPAPPPGDWVLQEDCGLYWSEQEYLFMDPHTRHFYDPNSGMWYDSVARQWYEGAPMGQTPTT